jgi:hypothetical protein
MTNEQLFNFYSNFNFNEHKVTSYEDYQTLLETLHMGEDDIHSDGSGHCCFGVTYGKSFNEEESNKWFIDIEDTITFEGELIVVLYLSKLIDGKYKTLRKVEHTYKLKSVKEVLKFAEEYDFNEHMVAYKDQLYFTLIGGGMKGSFIELEDGTRILVEDITD